MGLKFAIKISQPPSFKQSFKLTKFIMVKYAVFSVPLFPVYPSTHVGMKM